MADPTYDDLRGAYINAEARADQLAERLGKTDAELVETRGVARAAKEALAKTEASSDERGQAANHLIEDLAAEKAAREKVEGLNTRLIEAARNLLREVPPCETWKTQNGPPAVGHRSLFWGDWLEDRCPPCALRRLLPPDPAPASDNPATPEGEK